MKRNKTCTAIACGIFLLACGCDYLKPTGVRVELRKEAGNYLVRFESCRGRPIGVHAIRVERIAQAAEAGDPYYCQMEVPMSQSLRGEWRYGSTPPSGTLAKCLAIKPGMYLVDVSGGEAGGYRRARITEDGTIVHGEGSCD